MKVLISLLIGFMFFQPLTSADRAHVNSVNGLWFPSNEDQPTRTFIAFQYKDPQLDGLPIWGRSRQGATYMWQYKPFQQNGYYVTFWWSENSDLFTWDGGVSNSYYGGHPYPVGGASGTTHNWEVAGMDTGADFIDTVAGSPLKVVKDVWYTQALAINMNDDGTKTARFYIDLPSLADNRIIEAVASSRWGEKDPPHPAITFGDSPWWISYQNERLSGILGPIKIFNKSLSEKDLLKEAQDMSELKTSEGINNIWWGKSSFDSVDDLECDYGTNRKFKWANENKASLIEIQRNVNLDSVLVGKTLTLPVPIYSFEDDITISEVSMSSGVHFTVSSDQIPVTLNRGDSIVVDLKFKPQISGLLRDTVLVSSSSSNLAKIYSTGIGADKISGIDDEIFKTPENFTVKQNYPNPFNPTTTVEYTLSETVDVQLFIFNMLGRPIKTLVQERQLPGHYAVQWDGTNDMGTTAPSGIYMFEIRVGMHSQLFKMILNK